MSIVSPGDYSSVVIDGGTIWCGTSGAGVAEIGNGSQGAVLHMRGNSEFKLNGITAMAVASDGEVWVGSLRGVARFESGNWENFNSSNSKLKVTQILDICIDARGNPWVAGMEGIATYVDDEWVNYSAGNSELPFTATRSITAASDGRIVASANTFSKGNSFAVFENAAWSSLTIPGYPETQANTASDMLFNAEGTMWIATFMRGLSSWNGSLLRRFDAFNTPLPNNGDSDVERVTDIHLAQDGSLLIAASGLFIFDGVENWTVLRTANSDLPTDNIYQISQAEDGMYWLATDLGLIQFDGAMHRVYTPFPTPLKSNFITAIAPGIGGGVWVGSNGGATRIAGGTIETWTAENAPFRGELLQHIDAAGSNSAVAATFGLGVYQFADGEWTEIGGPGSDIEFNGVRGLDVNHAGGEIWIASDFGLRRYIDGDVTIFWLNSQPDYPFTRTRDVLLSNNHEHIWVAGSQNGLALFRDQQWTHLTTENSDLPSNNVDKIHAGPANSIWVNFLDDVGIAQVHSDGAVEVFTTQNSALPFNSAFDIATDLNGTSWFAFPGRVASFDGTDWTFYTENNSGITGMRFQAIAVDEGNNVWIGTANAGINFFGNPQTVDVAEDNKHSNRLTVTASIAPNPAANFATVKFDAPVTERVELALVDQRGTFVDAPIALISAEGNIKTYGVDLSSLVQGWYALRVTTSTDGSISLPLIVNR